MTQPDAYIRISTLNDTTQAQRSTEQLGDTLANALDTSPADRVTAAVTNLGNALSDTDGSASGLGDVQHGIDDVGNSAITTGQLIRANLISDTVMSGIKQLGTALKTTAVSAVSGAMSNEAVFAKASTLLTGNDLEKYFEGLIDISNRTGVAFADLAESMYSALSAGVDQENVLEFVENSVKLAKGVFTETATAIDVVTTAINAYHMEMEDATHIQDVLITTQNKGKTTVGELASSMGRIIPTAQSVNVEFEQLGAALATLTANGFPTADAATVINSMLNELGASGSTAEKAMMAATEGTVLAGKKFSEISAMGYDVTDVLSLMSAEAAKSGKSLSDMFSSPEASKAANSLLSDMEGFKSNIEAMANSTGAAASAADTMMDTTAEKVQVAKNQIDNLTTSIAQSLLPVIGEAAEEVSAAVAAGDVSETAAELGNFISGTLSFLLKNINSIASALAGITTSVVTYKTLMAGANFVANFSGSVKALAASFGLLKTSTDSATAAQTANNAAAAANPYMAVITAISLAVGGMVTLAGHLDDCNDKMRELTQNAEKLTNSSKEYKEKSEGLKDVKKRYEDIRLSTDSAVDKDAELQALQDELITQFGSMAEGIDLVTGAYDEQISALEQLIGKNDELSRAQAHQAMLDAAAAEKEATAVGLGRLLFDADNTEVAAFTQAYAQKYLKTFKSSNNNGGGLGVLENTLYFSGGYENRSADLNALYRALIEKYDETGKVAYSAAADVVMEQINALEQGAKTLRAATAAYEGVSDNLRQHRTKQQKSATQNNRVKAVYSIAKFRSHGALNQAVRHGLSAKIRFAKANMKLIFEVCFSRPRYLVRRYPSCRFTTAKTCSTFARIEDFLCSDFLAAYCPLGDSFLICDGFRLSLYLIFLPLLFRISASSRLSAPM